LAGSWANAPTETHIAATKHSVRINFTVVLPIYV
jgi:hypothetical protein